MSMIEFAMTIHPWWTLSTGALLGFLLGLLVKAIVDKVQDHETHLEVRTRGEDAIYADDVRGEDA